MNKTKVEHTLGHVGWSPDYKSSAVLFDEINDFLSTKSTHWKSIDTAPKDGTEIIVYCPPQQGLPHMSIICFWQHDSGRWSPPRYRREPTMWTSLP